MHPGGRIINTGTQVARKTLSETLPNA